MTYTVSMTVTATDFRKNLFQLVERALNGELIEIVHKNRTIRLAPSEPHSKLSRIVQRDTLNCTPEEFDQAVRAQDGETRRQWEQKWQNRL
jgi:antitoxin (DNA-binding transcriptional repressor) of toxin-antitoxin stability system